MVGQERQELDRVEYVRLSYAVRTCNAREWAEFDVEAYEVLEPIDFESRQHDCKPTS
jgi:hypothetical protein